MNTLTLFYRTYYYTNFSTTLFVHVVEGNGIFFTSQMGMLDHASSYMDR